MTDRKEVLEDYYRRCVTVILNVMRKRLITWRQLQEETTYSNGSLGKILNHLYNDRIVGRISPRGIVKILGTAPNKRLTFKGFIYYICVNNKGIKVRRFLLEKGSLFPNDFQEVIADIVDDFVWEFDPAKHHAVVKGFIEHLKATGVKMLNQHE